MSYELPTVHTAAAATTATAGATAASGATDALEAVAAVDRTVSAWLEGHFGGLAAVAADDVEELTLGARATTGAAEAATATAGVAVTLVAAHGAAGAAALGLGEAAGGVELLVLGAECELLSTVRAG
jgi:hypothetical protein